MEKTQANIKQENVAYLSVQNDEHQTLRDSFDSWQSSLGNSNNTEHRHKRKKKKEAEKKMDSCKGK